jgi:hypothetical protein
VGYTGSDIAYSRGRPELFLSFWECGLERDIRTAYFRRVFSGWISPLDETVTPALWLVYGAEYRQYETTEFSGDGSDRDVTVFTQFELPDFFLESVLIFHGDRDDGRGLPLAPSLQNQVSLRRASCSSVGTWTGVRCSLR